MDKVSACLWFDDQAEEAARFYVATFKNSKLGNISYYPEAAEEVSGKPAGSVLTVNFQISNYDFVALNGGPNFKFSEAVSFMYHCEDQAEVDELWEKLTADGGEESVCGWLKDKFGLSWQIIPKGMDQLLGDPDPEKANKAMAAMLKMKKINIGEIKEAMEV
jgi:predicted 3-demethylubiquinone-9 3-methyltransferase (glyoxalase superfamily)